MLDENSFSKEDEVILEEIGLSRELLLQILEDKGGDVYLEAVETILNSLERIDYLTDIVLTVPTVNYNLLKRLMIY